ncbi:hypothetical protein UFOVP71_244 [uncultured Caudovirales phage]|uniref:Uncharacterized protein n=1 Tax=uncultured Caudovirales phage TaxID=2100421 RepID=A0A6J5T9X3_9CAUD|nr:hypothetical protein UFOVP71_244 [uncultured Caudovirales phage]
MMYSVFKILQEGGRQLLLIKQADDSFSFAVYDEHSGNTLMRMSETTIESLERAIAVIKEQ